MARHSLHQFHLLNIFSLVLIRHLDVLSARLQVDRHSLAKPLVVSRESEVKYAVNVVIPRISSTTQIYNFRVMDHLHCPLKVPVEIGIHTLHILEGDLLLQNHLVESTDEERVQESAVENGQTHNAANELEVVQMLGVNP